MIKTIRNLNLKNKKVIIRCDFNVPIKDGVITDDNRIIESLETIKYALDNDAKVILMSHLGRVKTEDDKEKNSLEIVFKKLKELLNTNVYFSKDTTGEELEKKVNNLKNREVLLIENTRYEDIDEKKESNNDEKLGLYWASLADLFVNDAFGTSHRKHASNVGIASHLESAVGFLIEKELKYLKNAIDNPKRPLTIILGGSKVEDKIGVINNLVNIADYILIGGAMSYTFLKAKGQDIGNSLLDINSIDYCKELLNKYSDKIILPVDSICALNLSEDSEVFYTEGNIDAPLMGVDIGDKTIELFKNYIENSGTIIWNGPVGVFEIDKFSKGTKSLLEIITNTNAETIIGGGDTAASAINFGYKDKLNHISTGGGASLELLEGKKLPGIEVINK